MNWLSRVTRSRRVGFGAGVALLAAGTVVATCGFASSGLPTIPRHDAAAPVAVAVTSAPTATPISTPVAQEKERATNQHAVKTPAPKPSTPVRTKPEHKPKTRPKPAATGFQIPSLGVSAPLLQLPYPKSGAITPPSFGDVYLVTGKGFAKPGSTSGTTVVAMHASPYPADHAIGSQLENRQGRSIVAKGSTIRLADVPYVVTGSERVPKDALPRVDLASHDLVVITCSEDRPAAHAKDNLLIFGKKAAANEGES